MRFDHHLIYSFKHSPQKKKNSDGSLWLNQEFMARSNGSNNPFSLDCLHGLASNALAWDFSLKVYYASCTCSLFKLRNRSAITIKVGANNKTSPLNANVLAVLLMFDNKSTAKWLLKCRNEKSMQKFSCVVKWDLFFNGILSIAFNGV